MTIPPDPIPIEPEPNQPIPFPEPEPVIRSGASVAGVFDEPPSGLRPQMNAGCKAAAVPRFLNEGALQWRWCGVARVAPSRLGTRRERRPR